jgi:sulfonate transport system ATP-binding protein
LSFGKTLEAEIMGLEMKHVKKVFSFSDNDLEVLRDINLTVADGEIISIVGGSGCGKSTLLRIIAGLDQATSGEVWLDDKKIEKPSQKDIGIIFQESRLFPWSTVEKNVAFGLTDNLSKKEKKKRVYEHIKLVGLQDFQNALPEQLSGGMKQRVSIARSLINRPRVLLLDEPFGALDAFTKMNMQQEILNIWKQEKMTLIIVTHDIDEAIYLGDRVVVMSPKPGIIKNIIPIKMSRYRERTSDEFAMYRKRIYDEFFDSQEDMMEYNI